MTELKELLELGDLQEVWDVSEQKPTLLFKQSTTCPVSAEAFREFQLFLRENEADVGAYYVKVRESRPVSNAIADELGVTHQSPQIFLVKNKQSVWNTSHMDITKDSIKAALEKVNN